MSKLHIASSPLTGTIFAGKVLKGGRMWAAGKEDLTIEALVAVAEHCVLFQEKTGGLTEIRLADDSIKYTISVTKSTCPTCSIEGMKPSHNGSKSCKSGSLASGGNKSHCSCGVCF